MRIIILFCLLSIVCGCKKFTDRTQRTESLSAFREITVNSSFEIHLIEGNECSIKAEAAPKYINEIKWTVEDSVLHIHNDSKGEWTHPKNNKVKLWITCPNLRKLTSFESCNISTDNPITTPEFGLIVGGKLNMADIEVNNQTTYCWNYKPCGGTINFRGTTETFKAWVVAILTVDASKCSMQNAIVEHNGKNDIFICPTNQLEYKLDGNGNIELYSKPTTVVAKEHNGSGSLIYR